MTSPETQKVLIYRLGSLGDMLIALPAFRLVARAFPAARRVLLTNQPVHAKAPAAAAVLESTGLVQDYLSYPVGTRSLAELARLWWRIRRFRPEVVIYLAAARGVAAAERDLRFFRLCGARRVIGVPLTQALQENFAGASPGSTEAKTMLAEGRLEPEAERLARTLAALGDAHLEAPASWSLGLTDTERSRAAEVLLPCQSAHSIIAVSVGTKVQAKDWGADRWRALLRLLAADVPGHALALLGAPEEAQVSRFVSEDWETLGGGPVVNLCGELTPRESAAVLENCCAFLGHDSGPMHLAAAVGTPALAIFAARNIPRQWFPYGVGHEVVYHAVECRGCGLETCLEQQKKCLTSISVDEAHARARRLLERVARSRRSGAAAG